MTLCRPDSIHPVSHTCETAARALLFIWHLHVAHKCFPQTQRKRGWYPPPSSNIAQLVLLLHQLVSVPTQPVARPNRCDFLSRYQQVVHGIPIWLKFEVVVPSLRRALFSGQQRSIPRLWKQHRLWKPLINFQCSSNPSQPHIHRRKSLEKQLALPVFHMLDQKPFNRSIPGNDFVPGLFINMGQRCYYIITYCSSKRPVPFQFQCGITRRRAGYKLLQCTRIHLMKSLCQSSGFPNRFRRKIGSANPPKIV